MELASPSEWSAADLCSDGVKALRLCGASTPAHTETGTPAARGVPVPPVPSTHSLTAVLNGHS